MHSPSYDLPRETLPVREEAERRPDGMTHALRSMGGGASRYGRRRGEKKSESREPRRRHPNSIRSLARCQGHQMRDDLCGGHIHVFGFCALIRSHNVEQSKTYSLAI